ncbi:hypothetical protein MLD38_039812 [Melastoma candidum]|uniref:Uncharacterized protein n=1 Tax=Melastoma candidum TaxID=119954 RepID=A0ACB9L404_9MYRT|nr:hypothetical protein MLD38_039812 [Melastoma candidum]
MAETGLVAVGTRGTVGSLLRKEMEFYSQHQVRGNSSRSKATANRNVETSSGRAFPGIVVRFRSHRSRRKKKLPVASNFSDVARDQLGEDKVPGFSYRMLRDEFKDMQM